MNEFVKGVIIPLIIVIMIAIIIGTVAYFHPDTQERIKLIEACENACLDEGYIESVLVNDRCACDMTKKVMVIK